MRGILTDGGFRDVEIDAHDALIGGNTLEETVALSLRVGPLGMMLRGMWHAWRGISGPLR